MTTPASPAPLRLMIASLMSLSACTTSDELVKKYDSLTVPVVDEYKKKTQNWSDRDVHLDLDRIDIVAGSGASAPPLELRPAYRDDDLTALDGRSIEKLKTWAEPLKGRSGLKLKVVGHASSVPLSPAAIARYTDNRTLSAARAEVVAGMVRNLLTLPGDAITAEGRGDRDPAVSPGRSPENRRVEVKPNKAEKPGKPVDLLAGPDALLNPIPEDFVPWWQAAVLAPIASHSTRPVFDTPDGLYLRALKHSSQMQVFSDIPLIRETAIMEAQGEFDTLAFLQARYSEAREPVGSTLQTGGPKRFDENQFGYEAGLRKKVVTGGIAEISQRGGLRDNNSIYFLPQDQANSRLKLSFTQPILNGAGFEYNRSTMAIAKLDASVGEDEFRRQVESHLLDISRSYWGLYRERCKLLILKKLAKEAEAIVKEVGGRQSFDMLASQLSHAKSIQASRATAVIRQELAVRNAEARLSTLINDPDLNISEGFEMIPKEAPTLKLKEVTPRAAAIKALETRPEIGQAMKQVKAGALRANMAENELLPVLNLMVGGWFSGLQGRNDLGSSYADQFSRGQQSWEVGMQFQYPLENNVAEARHQRRRLELRQLTNQLRTTMDSILLEVQVSVRELQTAYRETQANYSAMLAAHEDLESLIERRPLVSAGLEWASASTYLERILDAQDRLAQKEMDFVSSQTAYHIAQRNIDRATGMLMQSEQITTDRVDDEGLPRLELKTGS